MIGIEEIAAEAARGFGQPVEALRGRSRRQPLVNARFAGIFLARHFTELRVEEIAGYFRRHHSIVGYAVQQVEAWREQDAGYGTRLAAVIARLMGKTARNDWRWGESRMVPGVWGWVYVGEGFGKDEGRRMKDENLGNAEIQECGSINKSSN